MMIESIIDDSKKIDLYNLNKNQKQKFFTDNLLKLIKHHYVNCNEYRNFLDKLGVITNIDMINKIEDYPFLPVRIFKNLDLKSVPDKDIVKILTSSGTSGQKVSKIYLDKSNSQIQVKVLSKIITSCIGTTRMPMLIIDAPNTIKNSYSFSARGAGILGFSIFGRNHTYALDNNERLDLQKISQFIEDNQHQPILIFGFTYIIWKQFISFLTENNKKISFPSNSILIHGGGWKKMEQLKVSNEIFKKVIQETTNIKKTYNYYGMIEQTGSIFLECHCGFFHSSLYADIVIRDPVSLTPLPQGQSGLIQLLSLLPTSYPGHSILTEDLGIIVGEDTCQCGRKGKFFKVLGRMIQSEPRGCSDTFE